MKALDEAVADHLAQLADGSNYGTLEELQDVLRSWSMDLRSGASSIRDFEPAAEAAQAVPRCVGPHDLQPTEAYGDDSSHCSRCGIAEYQL